MKSCLRIFIIACLVLFTSTAFATTTTTSLAAGTAYDPIAEFDHGHVTGTVSSCLSREIPVVGAIVTIKNAGDSKVASTVTAANGTYSLLTVPSETAVIEVSAAGYVTKTTDAFTVTKDGTTSKDITLVSRNCGSLKAPQLLQPVNNYVSNKNAALYFNFVSNSTFEDFLIVVRNASTNAIVWSYSSTVTNKCTGTACTVAGPQFGPGTYKWNIIVNKSVNCCVATVATNSFIFISR